MPTDAWCRVNPSDTAPALIRVSKFVILTPNGASAGDRCRGNNFIGRTSTYDLQSWKPVSLSNAIRIPSAWAGIAVLFREKGGDLDVWDSPGPECGFAMLIIERGC